MTDKNTNTEILNPEANYALISVIIPVYNIEKYVAKCINSILVQTYTNLEILLIDDGSTDNSGKICDDYAKRDTRIRVIHQVNQGLAEVRNVGIREAKGEYVQFVDGDDWIDPETIGTCYTLSQEYNADIVCFRYVHEYENGKQSYENNNYDHSPLLMNTSEALSAVLLPQYVDVSSWNKLIRKELFRGIEYPVGKTGEDGYTTYKFVAKAERILITSNVFYHYFKRDGSISRSITLSANSKNSSEYADQYFNFVMEKGILQNQKQMFNALCGFWFRKICYANDMIKADCPDHEYISSLRRSIKLLVVLRCDLLNFKRKIQFLLFKFSQKLYKIAYMKFKR